MPLPEQGLIHPGDLIIGGGFPYLHLRCLRGIFHWYGLNRCGSGWITGFAWFRVPETIKFIYTGKLGNGFQEKT